MRHGRRLQCLLLLAIKCRFRPQAPGLGSVVTASTNRRAALGGPGERCFFLFDRRKRPVALWETPGGTHFRSHVRHDRGLARNASDLGNAGGEADAKVAKAAG
jgi:hypothetical protein